ncbi:ribonuclease Oy-like [Dendronephthya gigantea]|uniref:ribonuclease Oy-like n=1 Tax=Dendronephthya gigantea TaxID=151771 RepID=UPI00106AF695|nr:ribonuclease Oy-like [Dendronephthya gigantea]XP_028409895.1 ribonuclease Oy-like [Dendronephthya gigantea]
MLYYVSCLGFFLCLSCVEGFNTTNYNYDHFIFTQQWPQSLCECIGVSRCRIPEKVKTWTIHGLWPTLGKTEDPQYCNRSWHFEESQILDIEAKMEIYWPELETSTNSRISFWEHEWEKHGTCCTDMSSLDSEHKYFALGLQLNRKYDILSMLNDAEILPSKTKTYKLDDFRDAVQKKTGHSPILHCCKTDSKQRVEEIMICLDKKFNVIDCEEADEECTNDVPVYYHPLNPFFAQ